MHFYEYLCREARKITDRAPLGLGTPDQWWRQRPHRRRQYYEMMGLSHLASKQLRRPPKTTITGTLKRDGYRVENLHFQSAPGLYIAGNLYVPDNVSEPMPAVLYLCGHSESPRVYYQAHLRKFAQLGFIALVIDTINMGELPGYHHGLFREGWWHWYSRGYTPAGVELLNAIRAVDFLQSLSYVDADRIGVTGISGGGATSWWLAAADERIACVAPVCATGTFASQIIDRTIDGQCDCMFPINAYGWDLIDVAALVAPRPCLIASADCDLIFTIASVREFYQRLKRVYEVVGASENLELVETPGRHTYHERSRAAVFSWFLNHLARREVPPNQVLDLDPNNDEPEEPLRVFASGPPPDEITTTIQDCFIKLAEPPVITETASLFRYRDTVISALREKTFAHFPTKACQLELKIEFNWALEDRRGLRFSFAADDDYRLLGNLIIPEGATDQVPTIVLQNVEDKLSGTRAFSGFLRDCLQANIELTGCGRTSWGKDQQWHLRRAAMLTGRTIASVRVWDTLRAMAAVRELPEVNASRIVLAGSGEMAAVALYAALLDCNVSAIVLHDPPATQNAPRNRQGGDAIEMLNCLRIIDLPQVAGLLFPTKLVFLGPRPNAYIWAEDLFRRLGSRVSHVEESTTRVTGERMLPPLRRQS